MTHTMNEPKKAYLRSGSWQEIYDKLKEGKVRSIWVKLEITPGLYDLTESLWDNSSNHENYTMMEASLYKGNIDLSVLYEMNTGDEDGFGVEHDKYLVGTVSPDGTIIRPLHIY